MHINQLSGLIPASFTTQALDKEGNLVQDDFKIKLRRMSYKAVTQSEFKAAMESAKENPRVVGELLAGHPKQEGSDEEERLGLLAEWGLYEDEENTKMFPITVDNIIERPFDFVADLAACVFDKLFPNPQRAETSGSGSAPDQVSTAQTNSNNDTTLPSQPVSGESVPGTLSNETTVSGG